MNDAFFGKNRIFSFQVFLPDILYQLQSPFFAQIQMIYIIGFIGQSIFRKHSCNGKAVGGCVNFGYHLYSLFLCPAGKFLPFFLCQRTIL